MTAENSIKSIINSTEIKLKEKGSTFIGIAYPLLTIEQIEEQLSHLHKKYYDSTHICYAYKLYPNTNKYSDDGEPNGTAGIRILNAILHFNLTNLLVVSIRYFGGTKLGVGLLGKTYYNSAFLTLENSNIIEKIEYEKLIVSLDFNLTNIAHHIIKKFNCKIINTIVTEKQTLELLIKSNLAEDFISNSIKVTNNQIEIIQTNEKVFI
ncbi:MAG: YigZ family protein [bacterium]